MEKLDSFALHSLLSFIQEDDSTKTFSDFRTFLRELPYDRVMSILEEMEELNLIQAEDNEDMNLSLTKNGEDSLEHLGKRAAIMEAKKRGYEWIKNPSWITANHRPIPKKRGESRKAVGQRIRKMSGNFGTRQTMEESSEDDSSDILSPVFEEIDGPTFIKSIYDYCQENLPLESYYVKLSNGQSNSLFVSDREDNSKFYIDEYGSFVVSGSFLPVWKKATKKSNKGEIEKLSSFKSSLTGFLDDLAGIYADSESEDDGEDYEGDGSEDAESVEDGMTESLKENLDIETENYNQISLPKVLNFWKRRVGFKGFKLDSKETEFRITKEGSSRYNPDYFMLKDDGNFDVNGPFLGGAWSKASGLSYREQFDTMKEASETLEKFINSVAEASKNGIGVSESFDYDAPHTAEERKRKRERAIAIAKKTGLYKHWMDKGTYQQIIQVLKNYKEHKRKSNNASLSADERSNLGAKYGKEEEFHRGRSKSAADNKNGHERDQEALYADLARQKHLDLYEFKSSYNYDNSISEVFDKEDKYKNSKGEWVDKRVADRERRALYTLYKNLQSKRGVEDADIPSSYEDMSLPQIRDDIKNQIASAHSNSSSEDHDTEIDSHLKSSSNGEGGSLIERLGKNLSPEVKDFAKKAGKVGLGVAGVAAAGAAAYMGMEAAHQMVASAPHDAFVGLADHIVDKASGAIHQYGVGHRTTSVDLDKLKPLADSLGLQTKQLANSLSMEGSTRAVHFVSKALDPDTLKTLAQHGGLAGKTQAVDGASQLSSATVVGAYASIVTGLSAAVGVLAGTAGQVFKGDKTSESLIETVDKKESSIDVEAFKKAALALLSQAQNSLKSSLDSKPNEEEKKQFLALAQVLSIKPNGSWSSLDWGKAIQTAIADSKLSPDEIVKKAAALL